MNGPADSSKRASPVRRRVRFAILLCVVVLFAVGAMLVVAPIYRETVARNVLKEHGFSAFYQTESVAPDWVSSRLAEWLGTPFLRVSRVSLQCDRAMSPEVRHALIEFRHVRHLHFSGEYAPLSVSNFPELEALWIEGAGPTHRAPGGAVVLERLPRLNGLVIAELPATGIELVHTPNLRWINIRSTNLQSDGISGLSALDRLEWLTLQDSPTDDHVLQLVDGLPNLKRLQFIRTEVTSETLDSFRRWHSHIEVLQ